MKLNLNIILPTLYFIMVTQLNGVSFVYNMRVAEITRRQALNPRYTDPSIMTLTTVNQLFKLYSSGTDNAIGELATYLYLRKKFYCKLDCAVGHVQSNLFGTKFSQNQIDDILLTMGYSKTITKKTRATISLLLGFPIHSDTLLQGVEFGTGHNGFGLQLDGAFVFSEKGNQSILAAARYIRFLPATAYLAAHNQCLSWHVDIGNLVDLIAGYNYRFGPNEIEIGYDASFLFGSSICPTIEALANQINYIRSNFYGAYKHLFLREKNPQGIIIALSYGFDNKPKIFKHILTLWATWGINF